MSAATTSAAELAAELVATMPAATSAAPTPAPPAISTASATTERDTLGRAFDSAKFKPEKDSLGRWKNLKGGRPPSNGAKSPETKQDGARRASGFVAPDAPPTPAPRLPDTYEIGAATLIGLFQAGLISLGQEEGILTDAEKIALADPLGKMLRKYDAREMPPELALAIAAASIVLPRMAQPKTQTSLQKIRGWVWGKVAAFRGARVARQVEAHVESSANPSPRV